MILILVNLINLNLLVCLICYSSALNAIGKFTKPYAFPTGKLLELHINSSQQPVVDT